MKKLRCIAIGDPSREAAQSIAAETVRLADERRIAASGGELLDLVRSTHPEMVILSLELTRPDAQEIVGAIRRDHGDAFVVATFRELSVPAMDRLGRLGVEDFIPQPIDYVQLFRAASQRFDTHFRRHHRFGVTLDVYRADGVPLGTTRDLSEGGMQIDCAHAVQADHSLLVDVALGPDTKMRVRWHILAVDGEGPGGVCARGQFQNLRGEDLKRLTAFLAGQREPQPT